MSDQNEIAWRLANFNIVDDDDADISFNIRCKRNLLGREQQLTVRWLAHKLHLHPVCEKLVCFGQPSQMAGLSLNYVHCKHFAIWAKFWEDAFPFKAFFTRSLVDLLKVNRSGRISCCYLIYIMLINISWLKSSLHKDKRWPKYS